jgi:uncharacterized surface protein with fasciclin (FAS1) repeats
MKKNKLMGRYFTYFLITSLFSLAMLSCKEKDKDVIKPKTITDIIRENNEFTIFREIIAVTGMNDALRTSNITVFAPNDAAFRFNNIPNASTITSLPKDSAIAFVQHHIYAKRLEFKDLKRGKLVMMDGKAVDVTMAGVDSIAVLGGAYLITKNLSAADNGIIHVIDRTLIKK